MISKKKKGKKNLVQSLTDLGIVLNCTNLDGFFVNKVITKESDMLKDTTSTYGGWFSIHTTERLFLQA